MTKWDDVLTQSEGKKFNVPGMDPDRMTQIMKHINETVPVDADKYASDYYVANNGAWKQVLHGRTIRQWIPDAFHPKGGELIEGGD